MRDDRREYVLQLADQINGVLAGEDEAEAHTAMTIAVVCEIVSTVSPEERLPAARNFGKHVEVFLQRKDIVDWIERSIQRTGTTARAQ